MRRQRNAKIIATLGPASSATEAIQKLFEAGADVFRFNFSHGSHQDHQARHEIVREVERKLGRPIAILADLQGPKLRIGAFAEGRIALAAGAEFVLDRDATPGTVQRVCLPHPELFEVITVGQSLLLDDGKLRLQVLASDGQRIRTRVITGGPLSDRKGVNVPDAVLPIPVLTEKDRRDLAFALALGVDWVALSFVQRPEKWGYYRVTYTLSKAMDDVGEFFDPKVLRMLFDLHGVNAAEKVVLRKKLRRKEM